MPFKVGEQVQALKNDNAMGIYYVGTVTHVHLEPFNPGSNPYGGEVNFLAALVVRKVTFGLICGYKPYYDIEYLDGTVDKEMPRSKVRKLA